MYFFSLWFFSLILALAKGLTLQLSQDFEEIEVYKQEFKQKIKLPSDDPDQAIYLESMKIEQMNTKYAQPWAHFWAYKKLQVNKAGKRVERRRGEGGGVKVLVQ